jgi:cobalt-precorrin-5B (C1)-methyltransferase
MVSQRTGFTTGTCAAAAAKAATIFLSRGTAVKAVSVRLPGGTATELPIERVSADSASASASVRKDAGDDPDVTDGCLVVATVAWTSGEEVSIRAGEGVGTVTKAGLAVPPGEPAINPVPRRMIRSAVREVTNRGVQVTVSIPGGEDLARKTFNPRLGVVGGLSILGTSGIVRPFSGEALRDALKCSLSVAVACKVTRPVFVPGRIGEKAAGALLRLVPEQLVEVSNEWGFMLDEAARFDFQALLALGHPGKLAKLPAGDWDTHSSRSASAVPAVAALAEKALGKEVPESHTVEGLLMALDPVERRRLSDLLAGHVREAIFCRIGKRFPVAVILVNLAGTLLGMDGEVTPWAPGGIPSP